MAWQHRFHLIGIGIGLVLLGILVTSEIPEFLLVKKTVERESKLLPRGTLAPDFRLPTVQGHEFSLNQLQGKPTVLIFTSSASNYSKELKEELLKLESVALQKHLVFVQGIGDSQTLPAEVQQLEDQISKRFTVVQDTARSVFSAYKIRDVPTTYQIDKEGKIRALAIGVPHSMELVLAVEANILSISRPSGEG